MKKSRELELADIRAWWQRHYCDRDIHAPAVATAYVGYLLGVVDGLINGECKHTTADQSAAPAPREGDASARPTCGESTQPPSTARQKGQG